MQNLEDFFLGYDTSQELFQPILAFLESLGEIDFGITKSQVAFRRRKTFAWVWIPAKYLHGKTAPLVLTLSFRFRHHSPRWKEIVEPTPGRFTHHIELFTTSDFDDEVRGWLRDAWEKAG